MEKNKIEYELKQLKTTYVRRGFKQLILRNFYYVLMQFMPIGFTYKLDLDKIEYSPPEKGLKFESMTIQDLDVIFHDYKDEMNEYTYRDLLKKLKDPAYNGFIMKKDDKICGYCFINYGTTYPILKIKYVDEKHNGYLLNDYVFKKYRGQKIQQYDLYNRLQVLKKKKYKTATGLVALRNYPSWSNMEKFGFKKCVMCYHFRCRKWRSKDHFKIIKKNNQKNK